MKSFQLHFKLPGFSVIVTNRVFGAIGPPLPPADPGAFRISGPNQSMRLQVGEFFDPADRNSTVLVLGTLVSEVPAIG